MVWISLFRAREKVSSQRKNKSILPASGLPGRKAPLAIVLSLPVPWLNQVKIRLVSEIRIRRMRMAFTVSMDTDKKSHAKAERLRQKKRNSRKNAKGNPRFGAAACCRLADLATYKATPR